MKTGNHQSALDTYLKSLDIVRAHHGEGHSLEGAVKMQIASLYFGIGDLQNALIVFQEALKIHEKYENKGDISSCLSYMSQLYLYLKDNKKAIECSTRSLEYGLKVFARRAGVVLNLYTNHASILESGQDYKGAYEYYNKAYEYMMEHNIQNQSLMSTLYMKIGQMEQAQQQ